MSDYLIETTCIYICALFCSYHTNFYVFIIMSINVKQHELWCTARDMRLNKCSVIAIISSTEEKNNILVIKKIVANLQHICAHISTTCEHLSKPFIFRS